jgi:hypothetical protein
MLDDVAEISMVSMQQPPTKKNEKHMREEKSNSHV